MIYEEHGLTTKIALNSALKRAAIEITSCVAPLEITTDVICTVDTTERDKEIRVKTIDDFVKFLDNHMEDYGYDICLDADITILAEEFLKGTKE